MKNIIVIPCLVVITLFSKHAWGNMLSAQNKDTTLAPAGTTTPQSNDASTPTITPNEQLNNTSVATNNNVILRDDVMIKKRVQKYQIYDSAMRAFMQADTLPKASMVYPIPKPQAPSFTAYEGTQVQTTHGNNDDRIRDNLVIKRHNNANELLIIELTTLFILGVLFLFFCQNYFFKIPSKIDALKKNFIGGYALSRHLHIEDFILLLFYYLNLTMFLYQLYPHYAPYFQLPSQAPDALYFYILGILLAQNIVYYVCLHVSAQVTHFYLVSVQYKMNVLYNEIFGYFLLVANWLIPTYLAKGNNLDKTLTLFIVLGGLFCYKKLKIFFLGLLYTKKHKAQIAVHLLWSELGLIALMVYVYFNIIS